MKSIQRIGSVSCAIPFYVYVFAVVAVMLCSGRSIDDDIDFDQLIHNSRDMLFRFPTGPVPTGTKVTLRLQSGYDDLTSVDCRVYDQLLEKESLLPATKVRSSVEEGDLWEVSLPISRDPTLYWYRFVAKDGTKVAYYEEKQGKRSQCGR
jgi:hypothetical protein